MRLHVRNDLTGIGLVPAPVQVLGHGPKLDDEVAGEVLRLGLAALLAPSRSSAVFVIAHDDSGVGATDESCAYRGKTCYTVIIAYIASSRRSVAITVL